MQGRHWGRFVLCVAMATGFACDAEDEDGDSGAGTDGTEGAQEEGGEEEGGSAPAGCEAGKLAAEGDIDGVGRQFSGNVSARVVIQTGDPATFDVSGAGDIAFHFEWSSGAQPNGTPFDVTGTMSIEGTDHCFSGSLTLDDDGWDSFSIGSFQALEGEACTTDVPGSLTGCADAS